MSLLSSRVVLARYPDGLPVADDFRVEEIPLADPGEGEVLVRNFLVTVDPGTRTRMTEAGSYAPPIPLGSAVEAASIGVIDASNHEKFNVGDVVLGGLGWQEYVVSNGKGLYVLPKTPLPWSAMVGVLGIPGLTAYFGLHRVGQMSPGETVLVSSAAGAVGSAAIQIAKLAGGCAVGIAGGPAKCQWVKDDLGADAVIDYKAVDSLSTAIREACPDGVDIYLDNVGNEFIDADIPSMNIGGRIVVSGQVAEYGTPPEHRSGLKHTLEFITHRLRMEGFVVFDDAPQFAEARMQMGQWIAEGKLKYREEFFDGIASVPEAFVGLFHGENFGRRVVRLGPEPS